jgi:hypothetical protein
MAGYEVVCVSRQQRDPYQSHDAWKWVEQVQIDRVKADQTNAFGEEIRKLNHDIVIDMICFTL